MGPFSATWLIRIALLVTMVVAVYRYAAIHNIMHSITVAERDNEDAGLLPQVLKNTDRKTVRTNIQSDDKSVPTLSSDSRPKLLDFFHKLCEHKASMKCCRNEVDISFLDNLTMTLGAVQVNNPRIKSLPPDPTVLPPQILAEQKALNCVDPRYKFQPKGSKGTVPIFESEPSATPRIIIDVTLISYELDMLEARLYQLNEVVDFFYVVESAFTHRGWKKPRFLLDELNKKSDSRFVHFLDKIVYINADEFPQLVKAVNDERGGGRAKSAGKDIFFIQNVMRKSVWPLMQKKVTDIPDETLVIMADLDWFPALRDLRHMKHCQPVSSYGWQTPFHVTMTFRHEYSLRSANPIRSTDHTSTFAIHTVGRFRELNRFPSDRMDKALLTKLPLRVPAFSDGTHMQLMGSLANILYRSFTHAEGAIILLGDLRLIEGRDFCTVDSGFLAQQQERLSQHAEYFNWRLNKAGKVPVHIPREPFGTTDDKPSVALRDQLREQNVPWPFLEYWERFPFYWGLGTLDMYSGM